MTNALNGNTIAGFTKATFHLSNSEKLGISFSTKGKNLMSHVHLFSLQSKFAEVANRIGWCNIAVSDPSYELSDPSYELTRTSPLAISPQLFHSKLKTLLFSKSYPDSSSSTCLPPRLNSKPHPP